MDHLSELENRSIYIIREANYQFKNLAVLWSVGKDSTTLVWLCMKAFLGRMALSVIHIDTSYKFPEMYSFRDRLARDWGLDLVVWRNEEAIAAGMGPGVGSKLDCCTALKTQALRQCIRARGHDGLLLGIRRDEHGIRAKERHFSPRDRQFQWNYEDQPPELWDQYTSQADDEIHVRVHPLLDWREVDIWRYVKREDLPVNPLYSARDGMRYRSLGCKTCCSPVPSNARSVDEFIEEIAAGRTAERAGRAQDKEDAYTMQKLRALGYM